MAKHYGNHRCHIEKNVLIAFILPIRWQDGAESLWIETTSFYAIEIVSLYNYEAGFELEKF